MAARRWTPSYKQIKREQHIEEGPDEQGAATDRPTRLAIATRTRDDRGGKRKGSGAGRGSKSGSAGRGASSPVSRSKSSTRSKGRSLVGARRGR